MDLLKLGHTEFFYSLRLTIFHKDSSLFVALVKYKFRKNEGLHVDDVKLPDSINSIRSVRVLRFQPPTVEHRLTKEIS